MNRNETIASIKAGLKKLFSNVEHSFSDYVLTDGTKLTSTDSDLQIGSEIYILDDQGNQTPLDNGDYVLNDGRTITVEDNKITAIEGGETTEDESPVTDANVGNVTNTKMQDGLAEQPATDGDLATRVTDLETQLEEILNLLKQMTDATNVNNTQMMQKMSALSGEPASESIKLNKKPFEEYSSKKINQRKNRSEIEDLRKMLFDKNKVVFK